MSNQSPLYKFDTAAASFLSRAEVQLEVFENEDNIAAFFYAALDLRFGIEARLHEYIDAALRSMGMDFPISSEYVATKLLRRLQKLNPNADAGYSIRFTEVNSGSLTYEGHYSPVTPRLAAIHGMLGEFLHYKFFSNNKNWHLKKPPANANCKVMTDFVALMKEGIHELGKATSGTIIHSTFSEIAIRQALEEWEDTPDNRHGQSN